MKVKEEMKKVYRSRISVLLVGLILGVFIPAVIPMVKHSITPGLVTIGGVFVFILFLLSGIRYIICDNKIYIKVWMFSCGSIELCAALHLPAIAAPALISRIARRVPCMGEVMSG